MAKKKNPRRTPVSANNEIFSYCHCKQCVDEVLAGKAPGESPQSYSRLSVGWTSQGLQVWCNRHNCNVAHVDFEGRRHPANLSRATAQANMSQEVGHA